VDRIPGTHPEVKEQRAKQQAHNSHDD
jgi:hypothetical protein